MPRKKRNVAEEINRRINSQTAKILDRYNQEKDPEKRLHLEDEYLKALRKAIILEISSLTERDWRSVVRDWVKPLGEWIEKSSAEMLDERLLRGDFTSRDYALNVTRGELAARTLTHFSKAERIALGKRRTLDRWALMGWLLYIQHLFQAVFWAAGLEPLSELGGIVARRFGSDSNWITAVALLAAQENLVKKKLVELEEPEGKIEQISREQGGFDRLVSHLAKLIEQKEGRKLSLSFYMTSSLRLARNKLEHEGYKIAVTRNEVLALVKDIRRFEDEIFPKDLRDKPGGSGPETK